MLLYGTSSYPGRSMQIPGIGVVLSTDSEWVRYRYLPFIEPIPKSRIDAAFDPIDLDKFKNIRFSSHWLFEISRNSFSGTVAISRSTGRRSERQHGISQLPDHRQQGGSERGHTAMANRERLQILKQGKVRRVSQHRTSDISRL